MDTHADLAALFNRATPSVEFWSLSIEPQTHMLYAVDRLYTPMAQDADSVDSQTQHEVHASAGPQADRATTEPTDPKATVWLKPGQVDAMRDAIVATSASYLAAGTTCSSRCFTTLASASANSSSSPLTANRSPISSLESSKSKTSKFCRT